MRFIHRIIAGLVLIWMTASSATTVEAKPANTLKAAFVRDGDLWLKTANAEKKLTKGDNVQRPKWSIDGEWLAYASGAEGKELRLLHLPTGRDRAVAQIDGSAFEWSPARNDLAFQTGQKLSWIRADKGGAPAEIAEGLSHFSWLPSGDGFIASTQAKLLPEGWTPVDILEIPRTLTPEPNRIKKLRRLPQNDFFAVGTSGFKYSPSGRWVAFIANPTASLSADGNALCLMSADGAKFRAVDQMLFDEQWFQWANRSDRLAYIGGVGREATSNKRLMVLDAPDGKPVSYTPKGYVDQGFAWEGEPHIVVSRAKEKTGTAPTPPYPKAQLVEIKLQGSRYKPITQPPARFGDYGPQYFPRAGRLSWVRSSGESNDVLVSGRGGKHPSVWIADIDPVADYYGRRDWTTVLAVHS